MGGYLLQTLLSSQALSDAQEHWLDAIHYLINDMRMMSVDLVLMFLPQGRIMSGERSSFSRGKYKPFRYYSKADIL